MAEGVFPLLCWDSVGERSLLGPDLVQQTLEKVYQIHHNLLTAQSRQKSYVVVRRRDLVFAVGDHVLLGVSPTKSIVRFGTSGKFSPRYIGPFLITTRVSGWFYYLE